MPDNGSGAYERTTTTMTEALYDILAQLFDLQPFQIGSIVVDQRLSSRIGATNL